ncbi:MAG TPA: DNA primase [Nevskiaceae bacterium]|nr:DNA primase [Nevskiaceae bacterium]
MDAVEEIKQRLAIEDVIGEYVQLKRAGRNWKGLSPFSNERTPSFIVSPEKQIWHDFSSAKGGDMFSFVMEMEGLDFKATLELLARKAGVDLEQYRGQGNGSRGKEKERLHALLDLAAKFYQVQFSKNQTALTYVFKKRQFSKTTALEWRLGYSPNTGSALVDFVKSKGFSEGEIKSAGLSARAYRGGVQDMFRGRLMIPLQDAQGQVIGFTARLLADDADAPKYINTPQTLLYDKSRHIYGLHLAKEAIRKNKYVVVAEGNLDVISSHQAGVRQVVATAGTALTEQHLKGLSRFTPDVRLCFDADQAGLNATERAIPIASKVHVNLSIISIPSGKDPDELIKQDPKIWQQIIQQPQYALDWLIERYQNQLDITSGIGKRQFSDTVLEVVRKLEDPVEQEHYLAAIAKLIGVSRDALLAKLRAPQSVPTRQLKTPKGPLHVPEQVMIDYLKMQNHFLTLMLFQPKLRTYLQPITAGMLVSDEAKKLLAFLQTNPDFNGDIKKAAQLKSVADYVKILSLLYEELYQTVEPDELRYEAVRTRDKLIDQYVKMQKQRLAHALHTADEAQTQALLEKVKKLDTLLKTHKGNA